MAVSTGAEAVMRLPAGISVVTAGAASGVAEDEEAAAAPAAAALSCSPSTGAASSASFFDFSLGLKREVTRDERRRPSLAYEGG